MRTLVSFATRLSDLLSDIASTIPAHYIAGCRLYPLLSHSKAESRLQYTLTMSTLSRRYWFFHYVHLLYHTPSFLYTTTLERLYRSSFFRIPGTTILPTSPSSLATYLVTSLTSPESPHFRTYCIKNYSCRLFL